VTVDFILKHLSRPKSVLILLGYEFEYFWNLAKKAMKLGGKGKLSCAHNKKFKDDTFVDPEGFVLQVEGSSRYTKMMPRRVSLFVQSGIFGFWDRWSHEWTELKLKSRDIVTELSEAFEPLSFHGSDVHLSFYCFSFFTLSSIVSFVIELSVRTNPFEWL